MHTTAQDEVLDEKKWSELTVHEKSETYYRFPHEFGEDATLEEWRDFIKKHQLKDI